MAYSYQISKERYNYLLPVYGISKLSTRNDRGIDKYYFIGSYDDYLDILNRCKYL